LLYIEKRCFSQTDIGLHINIGFIYWIVRFDSRDIVRISREEQ
jgi:hypothetical protein